MWYQDRRKEQMDTTNSEFCLRNHKFKYKEKNNESMDPQTL